MPSLIRTRVLLAGVAGCGCVALWVLGRHRSQAPVLGPFSPAALAALVLTAAAVVLAAGLALAPSRQLRRCEAALGGLLQWLAGREAAVPAFAAAALLVLAAASYAALTARFFAANRLPVGDQREYLLLAKQIGEGSSTDLIGGGYREANRHPFYPVVLAWSGTSELDPSAFARGKQTSVALAWLAFAVVIVLVAKRFSLGVAALSAVLWATNFALVRHTALVACEGLLLLWTSVLWLTAAAQAPHGATEMHERPGGETPATRFAVSARHGLALGAWAGLAYLTKGSALLLVVGLIVWLLLPGVLRRRRRGEQSESGEHGAVTTSSVASRGGPPPQPSAARGEGGVVEGTQSHDAPAQRWHDAPVRSTALVVMAFLLVASPLLLRNARVYGNPFYNSNTPFLFCDSFEEGLRRSDPSRPADRNETTWAAARRYFRTHSLGEVLERAAAGAVTEVFILLRALGPAPLKESRALFGAAMLLLAVADMAARPRRDALLVLIWVGLFIAFFGWYTPIAAGDRFVLPLVVPVNVYAASALARLAGATQSAKAVTFVLLAAALWSTLWVIMSLSSPSLPAAFAIAELAGIE